MLYNNETFYNIECFYNEFNNGTCATTRRFKIADSFYLNDNIKFYQVIN